MLERLELRNFQKHKKLVVVFGPSITSIIGPSDVGKSAIIRALRWVCLNKGTVKSLIKKGSKYAKATLQVEKNTITRTKGKKNQYHVNGAAYSAIGTNVPSAVHQCLRVNEDNFGFQFDAPFWFSKTAGQVSKDLNKIVNLELIDKCLSQAATRTKTAKVKVAVTEERLKDARQQVKDLLWVDEMAADYAALQKLQFAAVQLAEEEQELESLLQQIHAADSKLLRLKLVDANACLVVLEKQEKLASEVAMLEQLITDIQTEEDRLCQLRTKLKKLEKQYHKQSKGRCPMCGNLIRS